MLRQYRRTHGGAFALADDPPQCVTDRAIARPVNGYGANARPVQHGANDRAPERSSVVHAHRRGNVRGARRV